MSEKLDFPTLSHGRDCEHGHLARSCEICQYESEITELRGLLEEARELLFVHEDYMDKMYSPGNPHHVRVKDFMRRSLDV